MEERSKVYVANDTGHDYDKALEFGELIYVTKGKVNMFNSSTLFIEVCAALADSTSEDYILPVGLPLVSAITCAAFAYKHGRLNILIFRSGKRDYVPRRINLENLLVQNYSK